MALPAWSWPASGATARGISLVPYGSGIAVPDWTTPVVWPFSTATGNFQSGIVLASGTPGLAAAAADAASGLWSIAWDGRFWHLPSSGAISASGTLPSGQVYVGCAAPGGSALFLTALGAVLTTGGVQLGAWPAPARVLLSSGSTLATVLAASGVGLMNAGTGATGLIALPASITVPSCLAVTSGRPLGLAGWANAPTLSGAAAAAIDPQDPLNMLAVGSGFALFWRGTAVSGEIWSQTTTLAGLANLQALAWRPDGTQVLTASLTSNEVQVLNYIGGVLSLAQTVPVSGASSVAVAADSVHALVAQSGQSQLATLLYTSTWTSGAPVTGFPGVTAVTAYGASGAVVAWGSGISFLTLTTGSTWAVASSAALGFAPTVLTVDAFANVYAAGSGSVAAFTGSGLTGSGSWTGTVPTGIAVQEGRIALAVPGDGKLYIYGNTAPGIWTQSSSGTLALGSAVGLALSSTVLFAMGSGATQTYGFSGTPYVLTPVLAGAAAQWNGSTWTQTVLGIGHIPTCCSFDDSGDMLVATTFNALWTITSSGVGTSGIVPTYSGQTQTTPLGTSALLTTGGHLYAATSLAGVLVSIS